MKIVTHGMQSLKNIGREYTSVVEHLARMQVALGWVPSIEKNAKIFVPRGARKKWNRSTYKTEMK